MQRHGHRAFLSLRRLSSTSRRANTLTLRNRANRSARCSCSAPFAFPSTTRGEESPGKGNREINERFRFFAVSQPLYGVNMRFSSIAAVTLVTALTACNGGLNSVPAGTESLSLLSTSTKSGTPISATNAPSVARTGTSIAQPSIHGITPLTKSLCPNTAEEPESYRTATSPRLFTRRPSKTSRLKKSWLRSGLRVTGPNATDLVGSTFWMMDGLCSVDRDGDYTGDGREYRAQRFHDKSWS